jgi:hypothetical protein
LGQEKASRFDLINRTLNKFEIVVFAPKFSLPSLLLHSKKHRSKNEHNDMVGDSIIPWVTDRDESRSLKLPSKNKFVKYRYQHQHPTTNNQQPATSNQQPTTNNKGS